MRSSPYRSLPCERVSELPTLPLRRRTSIWARGIVTLTAALLPLALLMWAQRGFELERRAREHQWRVWYHCGGGCWPDCMFDTNLHAWTCRQGRRPGR